jgi:hypothetical protein
MSFSPQQVKDLRVYQPVRLGDGSQSVARQTSELVRV